MKQVFTIQFSVKNWDFMSPDNQENRIERKPISWIWAVSAIIINTFSAGFFIFKLSNNIMALIVGIFIIIIPFSILITKKSYILRWILIIFDISCMIVWSVIIYFTPSIFPWSFLVFCNIIGAFIIFFL